MNLLQAVMFGEGMELLVMFSKELHGNCAVIQREVVRSSAM